MINSSRYSTKWTFITFFGIYFFSSRNIFSGTARKTHTEFEGAINNWHLDDVIFKCEFEVLCMFFHALLHSNIIFKSF